MNRRRIAAVRIRLNDDGVVVVGLAENNKGVKYVRSAAANRCDVTDVDARRKAIADGILEVTKGTP